MQKPDCFGCRRSFE